MMRTTSHRIILVTAPDIKQARKLAQSALQRKLAACANLVPKLESHYWWKGKLESSAEVLILFKTTRSRVAALQKLILDLHPYETPEFITLAIREGSPPYLDWIVRSVA
jgi:periplasmic divalent cation tolerance protein